MEAGGGGVCKFWKSSSSPPLIIFCLHIIIIISAIDDKINTSPTMDCGKGRRLRAEACREGIRNEPHDVGPPLSVDPLRFFLSVEYPWHLKNVVMR